MNKRLAVLIGTMLISLPLTAGAAETNASAQRQPGTETQVAAEGKSNVSQKAIDNYMKREKARKQRDEFMKVRAKNVQGTPTNGNNLFRTSK